jgi:general secretion pathway protein D
VLVLDGRQARIQVGKQIPLNKSFATGQVVASEAVYIPVGIVLNIKPRVNEDGRTITMQVETIVSDTRDNSGTPPTLDNRQVQSFVRVANNTPFVIGGLLSDNITNDHLGIPLLSRLPFIGALFGSQAWHRGKREVIIVITPHVVPIATEARFSYVVPKASDVFNTLDSKLFRSAYRVRASDVGDYRFVQDAPTVRQSIAQLRKRLDAVPALKQREHFASLLKGHVPGDGVLVRRMVWEIIQHAGYGDAVQANRLQVLEGRQGDLQPPMLLRNKLSDLKGGNTLALTFSTAPGDGPLSRLGASISTVSVEPDAWLKKLRELNRADSGANARTILVNDARLPTGGTPLELLRSVMVLKRVLELNPTLGTSLASFQPGLQVLFPAKDSLAEEIHTIDETTARLFFEVADPFAAFQDAFKVELEQLDQEIKQAAPAAEPQPEKT